MPSSSFFLRLCTTVVSALLLSISSASTNQYYSIDTTYQGSTFFDGFSFFSAADPTHGFVDYLPRSEALSANLISYGNVSGYFNKDGVGRKSVRIESVKTWTHGLIILDIGHMPTSATDGCGTWPAFWTLGSGTWPQNGEMDIIEGANDQVKNFAAGHTGSADKARQCTVANNGGSGDLIYGNCNLYSIDPWGNPTNPSGCKIEDKIAASYGKPFNDNKGGVYAMEWTSEYIKTYFFPRGSIPTDIGADTPDPSMWPAPFGDFSTPCDIDSNYKNMQIIFDTTFCGDFGDATWGSSCAAKTGFDTCAKYVASKPQDFAEAYWQIESLKVYTLKDKPATTTSFSNTLSTTTRSTTMITTSSYSTRSSSTPFWSTRASSTSASSSTVTSSNTRSPATTSFSTHTDASSIQSPSTTSSSFSSSTPSLTTSVSRSSTASASFSAAYSPTSASTTANLISAASSSMRSSSSSSSSYLSSTTSPSTSTISKSNSASSSSTLSPASTWIDWSVDPAFATTTTTSSSTTSSIIWEDRFSTTSLTPAVSSTTTASASYGPSHSWAGWSRSSSPSLASTSTSNTTTPHRSQTRADWQATPSPDAASFAAAGAGAQYYPVSNASSNLQSWGPPGIPTSAYVKLTTMTVQHTLSVVADATQVWGGAMGGSAGSHASVVGISPSSYSGSTAIGSINGSGSPVAPSIATYTDAAVKKEVNMAAVAFVGAVALL